MNGETKSSILRRRRIRQRYKGSVAYIQADERQRQQEEHHRRNMIDLEAELKMLERIKKLREELGKTDERAYSK